MHRVIRSTATAAFIALAVQSFTVGVLAPKLPREVCRPGVSDYRNLTLSAAPMVKINNADGAVAVSTHDLAEIQVTADIRAYTQSSDMKPVAEQYLATLLKTEENAESLNIVTEPLERPDAVDLRVDYTVLVPKGTNIAVSGTTGNVRVGPGCGNVTVEGNFTDIYITEPLGDVNARSIVGRIDVVSAPGAARLRTVNGAIVAAMRGGLLDARTTNGNIYATVLDPKVRSCDLTVTNGNITLVMSEGCSAEVSATTGRGVVTSELPLEGTEGVQRRRELHGTIGQGQTKLSMSSLNGRISITRNTT
jgi:hypothetical protein